MTTILDMANKGSHPMRLLMCFLGDPKSKPNSDLMDSVQTMAEKGNEESQKHHHEESQAGYSRCMSCVRNQDVQNREGLRILS